MPFVVEPGIPEGTYAILTQPGQRLQLLEILDGRITLAMALIISCKTSSGMGREKSTPETSAPNVG